MSIQSIDRRLPSWPRKKNCLAALLIADSLKRLKKNKNHRNLQMYKVLTSSCLPDREKKKLTFLLFLIVADADKRLKKKRKTHTNLQMYRVLTSTCLAALLITDSDKTLLLSHSSAENPWNSWCTGYWDVSWNILPETFRNCLVTEGEVESF